MIHVSFPTHRKSSSSALCPTTQRGCSIIIQRTNVENQEYTRLRLDAHPGPSDRLQSDRRTQSAYRGAVSADYDYGGTSRAERRRRV